MNYTYKNQLSQWAMILFIICGILIIYEFNISQPSLNPEKTVSTKVYEFYLWGECLLKQGEFQYLGFSRIPFCLITKPTTDGGKICSDSSQCQGSCEYKFPTVEPKIVSTPITSTPSPLFLCSTTYSDTECLSNLPTGSDTGYCSAEASNAILGCFNTVENGYVYRICKD